jgi:hypothetical protein
MGPQVAAVRGKFNIFFTLSSVVNSPVNPEVVRLSGTGIGGIKSKAGTSKLQRPNTNANLSGALATVSKASYFLAVAPLVSRHQGKRDLI